MFVSRPLIAARNQVIQAIGASGVSWVESDPEEPAPVRGWRRAPQGGNPYLQPPPACPECGGKLVHASACVTCPGCGWGRC